MASLSSLLRPLASSSSSSTPSLLLARSFALSHARPAPGSRQKPTAHEPFPTMASPRRASAMDRMSPVDQAEVGHAAAPPALRPFNKGDILRPSDVSPRALAPRVRGRPPRPALVAPPAAQLKPIDPFYNLSINPANEYLNGRLLSAFVTSVGRIKTRAENGLLVRSQRRVRKGIRRAQAMGLMGKWTNKDVLGEKRPVAREGHSLNRDWSIIEDERPQPYEHKQ